MSTTTAYLERLGLDADLPPTVETLVAVRRAHVEQVPYTNLDDDLRGLFDRSLESHRAWVEAGRP